MGAIILLGVLFGVGALMVITAQPIGRPRPSLSERLESFRATAPELTPSGPPVFESALLEEFLRPRLESLGRFASQLSTRLGLSMEETEMRLRLASDQGGLSLFYGQKTGAALAGLILLPIASSIGLIDQTSVWLWLVCGLAGFVLPDMMLKSKAETSRAQIRQHLAQFADLLSLSVSAGMGLEQAIEESISEPGILFARLRGAISEARVEGRQASSALRILGSELALYELELLGAAIEAADAHGAPVIEALRAQAKGIRERRRIELVEEGEKALVRMTLPVGLLILPAFLILVLYPAAMQLLQITK